MRFLRPRLRPGTPVVDAAPVIAVTGAAGRVGEACMRALAATPYRVIAIDRRMGRGPGEWRRADLTRTHEARRALAGATHLVHLAGLSGPAIGREAEVQIDNVAMAANALEALAEVTPKSGTAVLASSMTVYGFVWGREELAPVYVPVDERHPCHASDAYSASKLAIEQIAAGWTFRTGRTTVAIRFPWVSADEPERIRSFLDEIDRDPVGELGRRHLWSYVHIDDLAAAIVAALELDDGQAHVLNIAAAEVIGGRQPDELVAGCLPSTEVRAGLAEGFVDTARARATLGWLPANSLLVDRR
jgi:nucleoside-diphosphate-sugar epimerase